MTHLIQRLILFGARVCESRGFGIAMKTFHAAVHAYMIYLIFLGIKYTLESKPGEGISLVGVALFWFGLHILTRIGSRAAAKKLAAEEQQRAQKGQ